MNSKEIEALLDKYYAGESTLEEEQQLRDFFTGEVVPPHLSEHAGLFRYFNEAGKEELADQDFESRFHDAIGKSGVIKMDTGWNRRRYFIGIAAGILLLAGIVFTFRNDIIKRTPGNSPDAEVAYRQATNALAMLSVNFNTGLDPVRKLGNFQKGIDEMQNLVSFQKGIDQMNKLSKFYQYQQIIINPGDQPRP